MKKHVRLFGRLLVVGLLTYLFTTSISYSHDPKFSKTQNVIFKVPSFYKLVCSGEGFIKDHEDEVYEIVTLNSDPSCPFHLFIKESDISVKEKQ